MTRRIFIEKILRQIYGGFPTDDSEITENLVNVWLNEGIAIAAKQNYKESIEIDRTGYINNSFYVTYSGLSISTDNTENFGYKITLPQIPLAMGRNDGIAQLRFKDQNGFISLSGVPLSMNQVSYADRLKPIPNKIIYWPESNTIKIRSTLQMYLYTAVVKMVSGGDDTDLDSLLNVPDDYIPVITDYIKGQLMFERMAPKDMANDGTENT